MSTSEKIIATFGHSYRLKSVHVDSGVLFILEARWEPYWYECQKWDDPGHVANLLLKHGIVGDHAGALRAMNFVANHGPQQT